VLPDAEVVHAHGVVTATVPRELWVAAVTAVRDDVELDGTFFDVLLGTDLGHDVLEVVVRLWSVRRRHGVHLRTTCPTGDARVPSLTASSPGAAWHERETRRCSASPSTATPGWCRCCCRTASPATRSARRSCSPTGSRPPGRRGRAGRERAEPAPGAAGRPAPGRSR
jgi:hypothetical protein